MTNEKDFYETNFGVKVLDEIEDKIGNYGKQILRILEENKALLEQGKFLELTPKQTPAHTFAKAVLYQIKKNNLPYLIAERRGKTYIYLDKSGN